MVGDKIGVIKTRARHRGGAVSAQPLFDCHSLIALPVRCHYRIVHDFHGDGAVEVRAGTANKLNTLELLVKMGARDLNFI